MFVIFAMYEFNSVFDVFQILDHSPPLYLLCLLERGFLLKNTEGFSFKRPMEFHFVFCFVNDRALLAFTTYTVVTHVFREALCGLRAPAGAPSTALTRSQQQKKAPNSH